MKYSNRFRRVRSTSSSDHCSMCLRTMSSVIVHRRGTIAAPVRWRRRVDLCRAALRGCEPVRKEGSRCFWVKKVSGVGVCWGSEGFCLAGMVERDGEVPAVEPPRAGLVRGLRRTGSVERPAGDEVKAAAFGRDPDQTTPGGGSKLHQWSRQIECSQSTCSPRASWPDGRSSTICLTCIGGGCRSWSPGK